MATLSVVLATFNEEKNLPDCLSSVRNIADEIIVVDGRSTDKTVGVATRYNARVVVRDNPQMFHINKQKAIDLATKDWILQLDADERATPELIKEIELRIKNPVESKVGKRLQESGIDGYWVPRKNWFLGRFLLKGGQYPDYTLRLYRRGKGWLPQKSVHEQAIVKGKTAYLKNALLHIAYPSFSDYINRYKRYTYLIGEELKEAKIGCNPLMVAKYMFILPLWWFFLTYIRHKGFMDSWQGLVFSFFSSLRFPVAYIKYIKRYG